METLSRIVIENDNDPEKIIRLIHRSQIGLARPFESPFGTKQILYW